MKNTKKAKKHISTTVAILTILALLLTGTYAWVDYSQHRTGAFDNENSKTYDIYLVEDFEPVHNWTTSDAPKLKNISVMNKGKAPEFGAGYVRLSLKEYFEFSEKTYTYSDNWYALDNNGDYVWLDPDEYTEAEAIAETEARGYYYGVGYETDYTSGVEGWFAIAGADHINGQYGKHMITGIENSEAESLAPGVERAEYEETENHKLSPTGECAYTPHDWTGVDQFGFRDYVKWNLGPNVISLTEWAAKSETGKDDFKGWIYDDRTTSGYVYWSQPLAPESNTTNLLETVELINQPSGDFYYALHVDMETLSLDELAKETYEWQDASDTVIEYWLRKTRYEIPETTEAEEFEGFSVNAFLADEWYCEFLGNSKAGDVAKNLSFLIQVDGIIFQPLSDFEVDMTAVPEGWFGMRFDVGTPEYEYIFSFLASAEKPPEFDNHKDVYVLSAGQGYDELDYGSVIHGAPGDMSIDFISASDPTEVITFNITSDGFHYDSTINFNNGQFETVRGGGPYDKNILLPTPTGTDDVYSIKVDGPVNHYLLYDLLTDQAISIEGIYISQITFGYEYTITIPVGYSGEFVLAIGAFPLSITVG